MNAKNFMLILRKAIREEVRAAVRQEVKLLLQEQKAPNTPRPVKQAPQQRRTLPVVFEGPLANILNETAGTMYNVPQEQDDWQEMGGGTFVAEQAEGFGLSALLNQETSTADPTPSHFAGDPTMAFVKDYSDIMSAADKHSKRG